MTCNSTRSLGAVFSWSVVLIALLPAAALAQSTSPQPASPRYSIAKTDTGFVRVDGKTGDLSFCSERDGKLTCRMAADERAAYQSEIETLGSRLEVLETRIVKLETETAEIKTMKRESMVPGDEELDQALKFADKAMRRFFNLVQELKRDLKSDKS